MTAPAVGFLRALETDNSYGLTIIELEPETVQHDLPGVFVSRPHALSVAERTLRHMERRADVPEAYRAALAEPYVEI